MVYINKATGQQYQVLQTVMNATNAQEGQRMILYTPLPSGLTYVMEMNEFYEKFKEKEE
ncbi:MAG: hypothetical protein V2B15_08755 [Bacteroidota bacterium]